MKALIDGDIICYRNAAVVGNDSVEFALMGCDRMMHSILEATDADSFSVYLTAPNNFRYAIYPDYKAHRKDKEKPPHLGTCKQFLIDEWNAIFEDDLEADDLMGIHQDKEGGEQGFETVICTIDKDLLQIPGYHYNFVKETFTTVSQLEGIRFFYKQMLIGDVADNLKGVDKIGPVKAGKLLDSITDETIMMQTVCSLYDDPDRFQTNADCFWIMRNLSEMWSDRKWN